MLFMLVGNRRFYEVQGPGTHVNPPSFSEFVFLLEKLVVIQSQTATSLAVRPIFNLDRAPTLIGQMAD